MRSKRGLTTPHPEGHQLCQYIIRLIRIQEERNIRSAKQSKLSGYHADIWQSACWWLHTDPVLPCSCLWGRQGPRLTLRYHSASGLGNLTSSEAENTFLPKKVPCWWQSDRGKMVAGETATKSLFWACPPFASSHFCLDMQIKTKRGIYDHRRTTKNGPTIQVSIFCCG